MVISSETIVYEPIKEVKKTTTNKLHYFIIEGLHLASVA